MTANPLFVVISGPSGVGKDTVIQRMKERAVPAHFAVTATTRPPRPGEREGVDYYFLSEDDYDRLLSSDGFLEHAAVYQHRYGIPKEPLRRALEQGRDIIVRTDVQGAETIRRLLPNALLIFLAPPSMQELESRLRGRDSDSEEAVRVRIETARREMALAEDFDYTVVHENDATDAAVDRILAIIEAERKAASREATTL